MKQTTLKIVELGTEGGSLSFYQSQDADNKALYYAAINEMGFEDIPNQHYDFGHSNSFEECFSKMINKYPGLFYFHPLYIHEEVKNTLFAFFNEFVKNNKSQFSNFGEWETKLK